MGLSVSVEKPVAIDECKKCGQKISDMENDKYHSLYDHVGGMVDVDKSYPLEHYLKIVEDTQINNFKIINLCGGLLAISNYPVLDLNGRNGSTDYIDFLQPKDLTAPIMRGIDCFRRPFITFRYMVSDGRNSDNMEVETIFQRYTDDKLCWTSGGYGKQISLYTSRINNEYELIKAHLIRLLKYESVGYISIDQSSMEYNGLKESESSMVKLT
jgi:hypothetical protein